MTATPREILTIGHSSQSYESFVELLRGASVTAIADVRTAPYSRHVPQFNRDSLRSELRLDNIAYVFLGEELGGRPKDKAFFCEGVADYEKMAQTANFKKGLQRVIEGANKYRVAMMCSEQDPLECHRCLLVGRALHERGVAVKHLLLNGAVMDHRDIEKWLIERSGRSDGDLFESEDKQRAVAYRKQSSRVAYSERKAPVTKPIAAE
jgi:uncharacterized protein (DUF488 family)